jgi:outer membrane autotransporter protein
MTSVLHQSQRIPPAGAQIGGVRVKRFSKPKLLLTTAILTVGLSLSSPQAWALTGCTVSGTTVTCTSSGNFFTTGITYSARTTDLTLYVNQDVQIQTSTASGISVTQPTSDIDNDIKMDISDDVEITTSGNLQHGIYVDGAATVDIDSGANIQTSGSNARGIYINDSLGLVSVISSGDIMTTATATNAYAHGIIVNDTVGAVDITSTGDITTSGGRSRGIFVLDADSSVEIKSYGAITTKSGSGGGNSSGILAFTAGDVDIEAHGDITTYGTSTGIYAYNTGGNAEVTVSGNITTGTNYISSPSTASNAWGVAVANTSGDVDVYLADGGSITTYGATAHGLYVTDVGGTATLSVKGDISTNGNTSHGISVDNVSEDLSISVSGNVTANGDSHGISVNSAQAGVSIQIDGSVTGGSNTGVGLRVGTFGSGEERSATISGSLGALSDIAIYDTDDSSTTNDGLTINNTGTITGTMSLNAGNDVLNNNAGGTWVLRSGSSSATADFGSGTDSVVNAGTLRLSSTGTGAKTGALTNLETFSNSGTIDMSDDVVGDSLTISGTFTSNAGELRLDTVLDDGSLAQTDTLRLTTVQTTGGATKIYVNNVGGQGGQTSGNGILLVDVASSSSSDAFTLGNQSIAGIYEYDLYFDATNYDWYLQSGLFDEVYEYPALVSGAMLAFQSDLDYLHKRLRTSGAANADTHIEPVAWTAGDTRKGGFWSNISGGRQTVTSGAAYKQQITRLEAGLEASLATGMGHVILGGFGGIGQNTQSFTESTSETGSDALIAGAYASYGAGGFYGDVIAKYERHSAKFAGTATADEQTPFGIDLFGLSLEAGQSLGLGSLAMQPYARIAYAKALAGSFEDSSGVEVDLEDGESLHGQLGTRFTAPLGYAQIYVNAGVKHQFLGETEATVSGLTFTNDMPGTQGLIAAGLHAMAAEEQFLLSFETAYAKGADASELAASFNMELKF